MESEANPQAQLGSLFGSYKAEWLGEAIFDLFTEPTYWPELKSERPCVLVGGRGTGKTTALRSLSYEGQYDLGGRTVASLESSTFFGFYERVDTNRVRAFDGPEVDESTWIRVFAHYLNLTMCAAILRFCDWHETHVPTHTLVSPSLATDVALSLNLPLDATSAGGLSQAIRTALIKLGAAVNNIAAETPKDLSLQKEPVDLLMDGLADVFPEKKFFFLFDEYENFTDYQQRLVNTLLKHSGANYTFKVGVREFGLRMRSTLNVNEQLTSPADYVLVSIASKLAEGSRFRDFAAKVCDNRLARLDLSASSQPLAISELLPGLSEDEEAQRLGIDEALLQYPDPGALDLPSASAEAFANSPSLDRLLVFRWADAHDEEVEPHVTEYLEGSSGWKNRLNNYRYPLLFTIQRGRGKGGIQKYYCGWHVYVLLAAGNIRYLLELVERALQLHLDQHSDMTEPVPPALQTTAAQQVGRKNLTELEGLDVDGAKLTRLVLGLGRIFQLLAVDPIGHAPEVTQFDVARTAAETAPSQLGQAEPDINPLMHLAVAHLALLRRPTNKASLEASEAREFEYRIHPIFCPAFNFSYRQKRKLTLTQSDVFALISVPGPTIAEILNRHNREVDEPLPEQLGMFEDYFGARS